MAGPVLSGTLQVTFRLLGEATDTVGAAGLPGGSSTSVTLMTTPMLSVPPLPSSTLTVSL